MAAVFGSAHSTSKMLSSSQTPSMVDTLPSINFGFDDLRDRMARFTDRFDEFIAKGRKHVLEERNQFRINMAELHGKRHLFLVSVRPITLISLLGQEKCEIPGRKYIHTHKYKYICIVQLTLNRSFQSHNGKNANPLNS